MEQRRLRLGDILDDYCPRERRITNHLVVAMIEDEVKQTRCTTCDADHEYKGARVPAPRRKKDSSRPNDPVPAAAVRPTTQDGSYDEIEQSDAVEIVDAPAEHAVEVPTEHTLEAAAPQDEAGSSTAEEDAS